jgi:hypothetical protein
VLFNNDCIVDVDPARDIPLLLVLADKVAIGVPAAIPVTANLAEVVETPPIRRSMVELPGYNAPEEEFQKALNEQLAVDRQTVPVEFGKVYV